MVNEYLENQMEVGTVLKETYPDGIAYYIVGEYFIYCNDYDFSQIRPHKFVFDEHISIASEDEKKKFIKDLKKNHLIWNEETGKVEREFEEFTLAVHVRVKSGMTKEDTINMLNNLSKISNKDDIKEIKFIDF